jgi:hypothetical protein
MKQFKPTSLSILLLSIIVACSDDSENHAAEVENCNMTVGELDVSSETAIYCATFEAKWIAENFGDVPGSAHFTDIIGASVNGDANLWVLDENATTGMEVVAEQGKISSYKSEINNAINNGNALELFSASGTGATGPRSFIIEMNREHSLVNFATMIAPSPDWFVGLSEYDLINISSEWLAEETVELNAYDAGTETGSTFSLSGTATEPAEAITLLEENVGGILQFSEGKVDGNSIASITFKRIE